MCWRPARFGRNLKTWPAQKPRRGPPHHKYAQPLLLNAFVCLFGSWALALKGSTSQFGLGRHLARGFACVGDRPDSVKIEKLGRRKSRVEVPHTTNTRDHCC